VKRGLAPLGGELGVHVCGGRGKHSRQTPHELVTIGERVGLDGSSLARTSRLVAKVDSAAVQDGFDLYLHGFIVTDDGRWIVVQQGMNGERRQAPRYHWLSKVLKSLSRSRMPRLIGSQGFRSGWCSNQRAVLEADGVQSGLSRSGILANGDLQS
jgi:hypothetical protein